MVSIDGTDISGATIDGTDVQEITVDGTTVWTAKQIFQDFEDGTVGSFALYNNNGANASITASTNRAWNGSYSMLFDPPQNGTCDIYNGDDVPETNKGEYKFYVYIDGSDNVNDDTKFWYEDSNNSRFFGINLYRETTGNMHLLHDSGDYDTGTGAPTNSWLRVRAYNVDWSAGSYDWEFYDEGNNISFASGSHSFSNVNKVNYIEGRAAHSYYDPNIYLDDFMAL